MCKNHGCCNCGGDSSSQNNSTENKVENVYNTLPGHPIIMIDDPSDLASFDEDGDGVGIWEGWSYMDGGTRYDKNNGNAAIVCHDMMDRCPVMAGNTYEVGDDFGSATVQLTEAQNGTHTHTITDPGHTHTVTDPGHTHELNDPEHTHTLNDEGHNHEVTNTLALSKNISSASYVESAISVDTNDPDADVPDTWTNQTIDLTGDVVVNNNTTGITLDPSETGVTLEDANTGVTIAESESGIALEESGEGEAHENRQPSYALVFIKRIYVPV